MNEDEFIKLFGDSLVFGKDDVKKTESALDKNAFLGLYFSAYWCPSCIAFTPDLVKFYDSFKKNEYKKTFQIVYISSDTSEKEYLEHCRLMPWLALPFKAKDKQMELARHYHVQSIPSLVIIDTESGEVLTTCGKACIVDDPEGIWFPWKTRNPVEVFHEISLVSSDERVVQFDTLASKIKGLYFSAHWCPPCKAFTPLLIKLYQRLQKNGQNFEVIFISSDRSEESYKQYFSTMPWLAVPYSEEKSRKELAHLYGVGGIPCLIVLDEDNSVITKEGRLEVNEDSCGEDFPWRPKLVDELGEKHITKLNEEPCLIYFTTCEDREMELAHYTLLPVAEEYQARLKRANMEDSPIPNLNFFYAGDAEICDYVHEIVSFNGNLPYLVILDIPKGKKYTFDGKECSSSEIIGKFVRDFISQKLTPHPIQA